MKLAFAICVACAVMAAVPLGAAPQAQPATRC